MPRCLFERASGLYIGGLWSGSFTFDPSVHVELVLADYPDPRLQRWDGALGVRAATAQETTAYDNALTVANVDADKLFRALAAVLANHFGISLATLRAEIITAYKALP